MSDKMDKYEIYQHQGNETWIYEVGDEWRVAFNPKTNCSIYQTQTKESAEKIARELLGVSK